MNDLTLNLLQYRECCRSLWNIYFLPIAQAQGWDIVDQFRGVTAALFETLVNERLGVTVHRSVADFVMPFISIMPNSGGVPISINRLSGEKVVNYWDDPINQILPGDATLQFLDFFDWQELSVRDFQYYLVMIRRFDKYPDRSGRRALIRVEDASAILVKESTS